MIVCFPCVNPVGGVIFVPDASTKFSVTRRLTRYVAFYVQSQ
jgi:hypothetical protein